MGYEIDSKRLEELGLNFRKGVDVTKFLDIVQGSIEIKIGAELLKRTSKEHALELCKDEDKMYNWITKYMPNFERFVEDIVTDTEYDIIKYRNMIKGTNTQFFDCNIEDTEIADLDLSTRAFNGLKRLGIKTVRDGFECNNFKTISSFTHKCLMEYKKAVIKTMKNIVKESEYLYDFNDKLFDSDD